MRSLYLILCLVSLSISCRDTDTVRAINSPVRSLADLPAIYQPVQQGSELAGRLKSQKQAGELNSEWRYNQSGNLVESRWYRSGDVVTADQYRYDVDGRLRFIQHFDNECMLSSYSECKGAVKWTSYSEVDTDNTGRIQEIRTYLKQSEQWQLRSIAVYAYNSQNQPVKVLRYTNDRKLASSQEFTYDSNGNITSMREINQSATSDLADRTFHYEYDKGLNPYIGTVHYVSPFFSSKHMQHTPGATYQYAPNGYPTRIDQNNVTTELIYY
ncbi:hypothetical protein GCM10028806_24860 [Spirosoma terrae]|uniref:RHS repeat protein n=1 Tax=Spirosoma terrae TaxID=1968276 RepID=A0A6L9LDS9_9BACT|nr:hypothetical protein [Spirosoma terrae]NDU96953.1 hypothetical protein [Spirosoma terrae]